MLPTPQIGDSPGQPYLEIDGKVYESWQKASVTRSLFNMVPLFSLEYSDAWIRDKQPWPILPGAECIVYFGTFPLLTGYVNRSTWTVEGSNYKLIASGRGKTQDLVDCSATHTTGCWRNKSMRKIAADICGPFGIDVQLSEPDTKNFRKFEIEEGEKAYDAIDRMARLRGYIPSTHPTGALILLRTNNPGRSVVFPVADARSREIEVSDQDRYSHYLVNSQVAPTDDFGGDAAALAANQATDAGVARFRPLVINAGAPGAKAELLSQATYERNKRAGSSAKAIYELPGFLAPDGEPWAPAMQCTVYDPPFFTDRDLLVAEVTFEQTNQDQFSRITLVKPETFTINDFPKKDKKALI